MAATKLQRGRTSHRHALLDNGIAALVFGVVCLALPVFLDRSPPLRSIGQMMHIPAAVGLALGVALLLLHASARRHPRAVPHWPANLHVGGGGASRTGDADWSGDLLDDMDAPGFEAACELLFAQAGFMTRRLSEATGGGADICLYSKHARGPAAIVRCAHEAGATVGIDEVCAFYGVMVAHQVRRGMYVTNARFTEDARQFGRNNGINLLDGQRLLAVVATRTPQQRGELLAAASERV